MARNPYAISGQKPLISDLGNIGDAPHTVTYLTAPANNPWATAKYRGILTPTQAVYANLKKWGVEDVPKGQGALFLDPGGDPFHPVVHRGRPGPDINWTYASPAEYRAWAKAELAARTAAQKKAAAAAKAKPGGTATGAGTTTAAGTAAGAAAATGGGTAGATGTAATPSYSDYFNVDPTLQAALGQINAAGITGRSQLVGGEQQLFGRLGEAPDLSQPQFANLAPELRSALQEAVTPELQGIIGQSNQAGTSALSKLLHDYGSANTSAGADYAARGGRSGGYGMTLNNNLRSYTLNQYNARQTALDTLSGLQGSYLTNQQALAGQAGEAVSAAQGRASTLIGLGQGLPLTGTGASPVATGGGAEGSFVDYGGPGGITGGGFLPSTPGGPIPPGATRLGSPGGTPTGVPPGGGAGGSGGPGGITDLISDHYRFVPSTPGGPIPPGATRLGSPGGTPTPAAAPHPVGNPYMSPSSEPKRLGTGYAHLAAPTPPPPKLAAPYKITSSSTAVGARSL